jgi:hypothetical protein
MYLENILKEVFAVEGSEQILLEAMNYLAIAIYFGQPSNDGMFSRDSMGLGSPLSDRSMSFDPKSDRKLGN